MITTNEMNFRVEERNFYALYGYDRWNEIWEKDAIEYLLLIAQKRFKNFPIYYFLVSEDMQSGSKGRIILNNWKKKLQYFRSVGFNLINAGEVMTESKNLFRWCVGEVNEDFMRENIRNISDGHGVLFTVMEEIDYSSFEDILKMGSVSWSVPLIEKMIEKRIYPITISEYYGEIFFRVYWESQRWPREDEKPVSLPQVKEVII